MHITPVNNTGSNTDPGPANSATEAQAPERTFFSSRALPKLPMWGLDVLVILVLLAGAYLRAIGTDWGEYQYLHPDERFLIWVGTDISPTHPAGSGEGSQKNWISLSEYFDTAKSPLNPNNRGHGFYVYGTLPMFITRFAVEWIYDRSGFDVMTDVGRALSAISDLMTVLVVYLIAARLYDRRVGLLAAAFSSAAVLQIQQSHFFTMDTFSNLFAYLAIYFSVRIMTDQRAWPGEPDGQEGLVAPQSLFSLLRTFFQHPLFWPSLAFGLFYGAAMASKISIIPIALLLPVAIAIRISRMAGVKSLLSEGWRRPALQAILYIALAGIVSFAIFRLAQPYAFSGPGLFDIRPNPSWLAQIREQRSQATDEVDFPPAMQWARRPIWFSFQNLTVWGLGLPLGLLAWAGFLWAGWEMLRGRWRTHLLLWGWTAFYFIWQSLALNPTMRYQMPIYPALAIFAAWGVIHIWDVGIANRAARRQAKSFNWQQVSALLIAGLVLLATYGYAYAFARIYTRPITRVEGSRWIYQNVPGPINLRLQTAQGLINQPLPFPYNRAVMAGAPYQLNFTPSHSGDLAEVYLPRLQNLQLQGQPGEVTVTIARPDGVPLSSTRLVIEPNSGQAVETGEYTLHFDPPVTLEKDQVYQLVFEARGAPPAAVLDSRASLRFINENGQTIDYPAFPGKDVAWQALDASTAFSADSSGVLIEIFVPGGADPKGSDGPVQLLVDLQAPDSNQETPQEYLSAEVVAADDPRGPGYAFRLPEPLYLEAGQKTNLNLSILEDQPAFSLSGAGLANEGEWDDGMPLRIDGYDGFGGIYPLDLNFNMYWDDNPEKRERFLRILDESDYIVITSNRQWGSLPRIPERFPLTSVYYRSLLGCPVERDIVWCYRVAQPGQFESEMGFDLVKTFQSDPQLGELGLNDQFAEEAFTVYDHPKVLIFEKTANYDAQKARQILESVDLSKVIRLPPLKFKTHPADLLLPLGRWVEQQQGGTWSELFNPQSWLNRSQPIAVLAWYISLAFLGLLAYPIVRLALPGLDDKGYPLARIAGLLILAYPVWIAGSLPIPFTRTTISLVLLILFILSILLAYRQRHELAREWRARKKYYLLIEGLFLAFFLFDLLIRLGNPDLWHPFKGGEKPMDFSYLNAVLKSTSFPPYDPWFAGGYLNYYYYGFVLVGVLIKWLGITPAVAYNLILPGLFAMIAMGAFSIAWNIYMGVKRKFGWQPFWVGIAGALGMAVLGNLGTVKMINEGLQRLAAPGGAIGDSNLLMRLVWAVQGFMKNLTGTPLPYGVGDWYWNPSRAIPAPGEVEPITEFPFFTVLYADPHAHLFSMPIALLALGFALSVILARGRWKSISAGFLGFLLGGLAIGALRPTNTWDFYPYLTLGAICLGYALWRYYPLPMPVKGQTGETGSQSDPASKPPQIKQMSLATLFYNLPVNLQRLLVTLGGILLLVGLSVLLYRPYSQWYGQGYSKIDFWQGLRTPLTAYLTHWGLFLFVIVTWLVLETRDWMARTPVSALHRLRPYRGLIIGLTAFLLLAMLGLAINLPTTGKSIFGNGVSVAWLALPLAAWTGILLLRPDQPDAKRFNLFLIGTGLVLTLMVEVIVLVGDIGRMNTVFKFYLQVWTFLAVSAAAALGWLLETPPALQEQSSTEPGSEEIEQNIAQGWSPRWRTAWSIVFILLVAGAALYPLTAGRAKILDRMTDQAPHTLDGLKFMEYANYDWQGPMDLSQDYRAIRWMQENVEGSPVIVEANLRDLYRWGSRFTIYTGLPGVVGWEWHQQQQRALTPGSWVSERIAEVDAFYNTTDLLAAQEFLQNYAIRYIILGQLERNHYPGPGLDKFPAQAGVLWDEVYRDGSTIIYKVKE